MSNGTDRVAAILDSCRGDAQAQVAALQELIAGADPADIRTMAIAAENTAKTVQKLCSLSLNSGGDDVLARAAA